MSPLAVLGVLSSVLLTLSKAFPSAPNCIISEFSQVESVVSSCTDITISSLTVPAGKGLELNLKKRNTTVTFEGTTKFEFMAWSGPLLRIQGKKITVQGAPGSVLDGQGALYWDGKGGTGSTKPKFFKIKASEGSIFKNINMLNCPKQCASIQFSDQLTISGWNIDVSAGDKDLKGKNTDGFDISKSTNIVIENTVVKNQDDCIAVNQGSNMYFSNLQCSGGHGLSLSVGLSTTDIDKNTVSNITFIDSSVSKSRNGIHIKTHTDAGSGSISDVTYKNIKLSDITYFGVNIQEDYKNGHSTGIAKSNIPITGLTLSNISGTMTGPNSTSIYILCGTGGCKDWTWSKVTITGASKKNNCSYIPSGYSC